MSLCSGPWRSVATAVLLPLAAALGACTTTPQSAATPGEQAQVSAPPAPPSIKPPPTDLGGRWRLASASGGACLLTLTATPGAAEGMIAPAGGCPGNFFTSRKWTFEHDVLIIRDHKSEALAELSFSAGRFQGQATGGDSVTLARP